MAIEFELKYQASAAQIEAVAAAFPGEERLITMQTTYFDTPSRSLSARHITCRTRLENGVSVCTVKTPAKDGARDEFETECDNIEEAISRLCKLGCPEELLQWTAEGLEPICGARFTRRAKLVAFPGGTAELALDQGVLLGGGKEIPLEEIELELKSGEIPDLQIFGVCFAGKFGLTRQKRSKFRRALDLAEGE